MTRNIQDVLGQGERLDRECGLCGQACGVAVLLVAVACIARHSLPAHSVRLPSLADVPPTARLPAWPPGMTEMSNMLSQDAKQFAVKAKDLYHQVGQCGAACRVG